MFQYLVFVFFDPSSTSSLCTANNVCFSLLSVSLSFFSFPLSFLFFFLFMQWKKSGSEQKPKWNTEAQTLPFIESIGIEPSIILTPSPISPHITTYFGNVSFDTILITVSGKSLNCQTEVRLDGKYGPSRYVISFPPSSYSLRTSQSSENRDVELLWNLQFHYFLSSPFLQFLSLSLLINLSLSLSLYRFLYTSLSSQKLNVFFIRPSSYTLGLGLNKITLVVVDITHTEPWILTTYTLNIYRNERSNDVEKKRKFRSEINQIQVCSLKQVKVFSSQARKERKVHLHSSLPSILIVLTFIFRLTFFFHNFLSFFMFSFSVGMWS